MGGANRRQVPVLNTLSEALAHIAGNQAGNQAEQASTKIHIWAGAGGLGLGHELRNTRSCNNGSRKAYRLASKYALIGKPGLRPLVYSYFGP